MSTMHTNSPVPPKAKAKGKGKAKVTGKAEFCPLTSEEEEEALPYDDPDEDEGLEMVDDEESELQADSTWFPPLEHLPAGPFFDRDDFGDGENNIVNQMNS